MKRIDFENGTVTGNILGVALPMLAAQLLNLLYNIVDRVYIARIPHEGTAALGAVGICFPLIVIITAFANLFGGGGAPLFSIYRGKKEEKTAVRIMNTSFSMICASAVLLMRIPFCISGFDSVRNFQRCNGLCISIYDDLSDRYSTFNDRGGNESVH